MGNSEAEEFTLEPDELDDENNPIENLSSDCFFSPGRRRFVPFLDIRFYDGDTTGVRYTHIDTINQIGGKMIILLCPLYQVKIEGRNLKTLYQRLLTESVVWISELPEERDKLAPSAVVVNSIKLIPNGEETE